jgi:hypothetical protein
MSGTGFQLDSETGLPTVRNFGELGDFLRGTSNEGDSALVSAGMTELAARVESVGHALENETDPLVVGSQLVELLTTLRMHRTLIVGLGAEWRGLYEYAAYLAALNNFRVLVSQWLTNRGATEGPAVTLEDFRMIGWRTLGEGMIMIDMFEQWRRQVERDSTPAPLDDAQLARARHWWKKLRG